MDPRILTPAHALLFRRERHHRTAIRKYPGIRYTRQEGQEDAGYLDFATEEQHELGGGVW